MVMKGRDTIRDNQQGKGFIEWKSRRHFICGAWQHLDAARVGAYIRVISRDPTCFDMHDIPLDDYC